VDVEGKREWDADEFGYKLISIYNKDTGSENEGGDQEPIQDTLKEIYQLLIFLWALLAKQYGSPVTLRETPDVREVISLCDRKSSTLDAGAPSGGSVGSTPDTGAIAESRKLAEAMVLNLNRSSELIVKQISTTESSKSSLSRLAPDQATLFKLLTAESFEAEGVPELNEFTTKITQSRDPMTAIKQHGQTGVSRLESGDERSEPSSVPELGLSRSEHESSKSRMDSPASA
jgi:hypothetical protein